MRAARESRGFTQEEAAHAAGIDYKRWQRLEQGTVNPTVKTQRMILWGLIESDKTWDPRTQCQNGISKVDVTEFFTLFGIYGTYELTAWCAAGSQAQGSNTGSVIIVR